MIFTIAGKGGVGKTSTAMLLAQRATRVGELKVALIDGNRGQGDTRVFLRLARSTLPTIYDVATGAAPEDVIISPTRLGAARPSDIDPVHFALAMAPPPSLADHYVVTSETYSRVLATARAMADLVVVDTQITEATDTSGLFDEVWTPAMRTYAWTVAISDLSSAGAANLQTRLQDMINSGVPTERVNIFINRVDAALTGTFDEQQTKKVLSQYGYYLGNVIEAPEIKSSTNLGELPYDHPNISGVLDKILFRATQDGSFSAPPPEPESKGPARRGLRGLLGRGR